MEAVEFEIVLTVTDWSADFKIDGGDQVLQVDFAVYPPHLLRLAFRNPDDALTLSESLREWGERFKATREPEPYPVPQVKPHTDSSEGNDPND